MNGRFTAACTTPVADGAVVENDTPELRSERRTLLEMLFVEGNHTCPACEKTGDCDLQAQAYRLGLDVMRLPYQSPRREIDASHPEIFLDRNTCILCGLCVRASRLHDHKSVFGLEQRGIRTRIAVNAVNGLAGTTISPADEAVAVCPVACIVRKRTGFSVPIGERRFDRRPIGAEIEARRTAGDGGDA